MKRCLLPLALLLALAGTAHAQSLQRSFPKEALRGAMTVKQPPYVEMDDRAMRLTPGARIRNASNGIVRPSSLVNQEVKVNYVLDRRGQVSEVWILTAEEAKEKRPGFGVERNYRFESQQPSDATTTAPAAAPAAN